MVAMKMAWHAEADRLVCRWSEAGERVQYNPHWAQGAPVHVQTKGTAPTFLAFTKLSPFGRIWCAPDRQP